MLTSVNRRCPTARPFERPVVTVIAVGSPQGLQAVVDSGSQLSVADAMLFPRLGISLERDEPLSGVRL
jgi:hypothetical protein